MPVLTRARGQRLSESLLDASYVVLDFETTGLSPARGSEVIETGAVRLEGGDIVDSFQRFSRPLAPIPPSATLIHGITDEMVRDEPPFTVLLPELLAFLGEHILVAHNAPFDFAFLNAALERTGRPALPNPVLDTVRLSRRLFPELVRHDLQTLCHAHRISREREHRALDDARATAELLRILLVRAHETGVATPDELQVAGTASGRAFSRAARPTVALSPAARDLLEEAIVTGDRLEIRYLTRTGQEVRRPIVPYQLRAESVAPRLIAYDLERGTTRTFRLECVRDVSRPAAPLDSSTREE